MGRQVPCQPISLWLRFYRQRWKFLCLVFLLKVIKGIVGVCFQLLGLILLWKIRLHAQDIKLGIICKELCCNKGGGVLRSQCLGDYNTPNS